MSGNFLASVMCSPDRTTDLVGNRFGSPVAIALLELGQERIAQAGGVVAPPDVGVDDPPGHPVLPCAEQGDLERRRRRPVARAHHAHLATRSEATRTVVLRAAFEDQRRPPRLLSR